MEVGGKNQIDNVNLELKNVTFCAIRLGMCCPCGELSTYSFVPFVDVGTSIVIVGPVLGDQISPGH